MILLGIDPGPVKSAWLIYDAATGIPCQREITENRQLLYYLRTWRETPHFDRVVIEKVESMGMAVGAEVFETVWWSGQFAEAAAPVPVYRVTRRAVKLHLCQSMRAKDGNVRQALIDRFGGSAAIGRKAKPGPLHGIASDLWSALAIAVCYADGAG